MNEAVAKETAFSLPTCAGLFVLEACYLLFFYDPLAKKTQAGLMAIFAAEAAYMVKIGKAQLEEKRAFGKVSLRSRLYAASFLLPLLGVMIFALTTPVAWLMAFLLAIALVGKIAWYKHNSRLGIEGA